MTHIYGGYFHSRTFLTVSALLFALLTSIGVLSLSRPASAETAESFCSKYTTNAKLNACKAGIRGDECSDYVVTHDQETADVCTAATEAKKSGQISEATNTPNVTTPSSTDAETYRNNIVLSCSQYSSDPELSSWCLYGGMGTNSNSQKPKTVSECLSNTTIASKQKLQSACITGATAGQSFLADKNGDSEGADNISTEGFALQDILDQTQSLSDLIDVMHSLGLDKNVVTNGKAGNNYDSYINGAGEQQDINVFPCKEGTATNAAGAATSATTNATNAAFSQGAAAQQGYDQGYQAGLQAAQKVAAFANNSGTFNSSGAFNNFGNLLNFNSGNKSTNSTTNNFGEYNPFDVQSVNTISDLLSIGPGAKQGYQAGYNQGVQSTNGLTGLTSLLSKGASGLSGLLGGSGSGSGLSGLTSLLGGIGNLGNSTNNTVSNFGVAGTGCPAILWVNGGGWHSNDNTAELIAIGSPNKNGISNQTMERPNHGGANERGYTVIEITYRLGSSGVYYMLEDVLRGVQHVRNNAGMYGIDPSKIVLGGDSAGGSLAVRAASTGRTGAKAMVGWSPPTNAYTGLFRSYKSFFIGMDHSTCIPTDIAGLANFTDLLAGGGGDIAEYGRGFAANDFSSVGINPGAMGGLDAGAINPISTITQVLLAGQYLADAGSNIESISSQLEGGGLSGISGSLINLSSKKLIECLDNFNSLSPALFASPDSPPGFFAGFDTDEVVGPEQVTGMKDKLRGLGLKAEAVVLPGDPNPIDGGPFGPNGNHMGYDPRFVCITINFIDEVVRPDKQRPDCDSTTPVADTGASTGGASSGGGAGGGGGGIATNGNSNGSSNVVSKGGQGHSQSADFCDGTWKQTTKGGFYCVKDPVVSQPSTTTSDGFVSGTQGCANGAVRTIDPATGKPKCG